MNRQSIAFETKLGVAAPAKLVGTMNRYDEIEALHRDQHVSLTRTAFWITGDIAEAEELVQEAFIRLAESADRLDKIDNVAGYLHSIVVNLSRSRLRRIAVGRRKLELAARRNNALSGTDIANAKLLDSELGSEVRKLPKRQLECVVFRFQADMTVPQIAKTLGIAEGSVKSHLHRALSTLKDQLPEGGHDAS